MPAGPIPARGVKAGGGARFFHAADLYDNGYGANIVSVIPPGAELSPQSNITPESVGKIPGRKNQAGSWGGFAWQDHQTTRAEAERIHADRASIGLKASVFPGLDLDITAGAPAAAAMEVVQSLHPGAAYRVGNSPKCLFPFRLAAGASPFRKKVLAFSYEGTDHKVEFLGHGQQYVADGFHPKTRRPYHWAPGLPAAAGLPEIDEEGADALIAAIQTKLEEMGAVCKSVSGGGSGADRSNVDQEALKAKDMKLLEEVVRAIPNNPEDDRGLYIQMCAALKGATQDDPDNGFALWLEWAAKWPDPKADPDYDSHTWETMQPPFSVGVDWIFDLGRKYGKSTAQEEFDIVPGAEAPAGGVDGTAPKSVEELLRPTIGPDNDNDTGNAERFALLHGGRVRYCADQSKWYAWDGTRWKALAGSDGPPAVVMSYATSTIRNLQRLADTHLDGQERLRKFARSSLMLPKLQAMVNLARTSEKIHIPAERLDDTPGLLNFRNGTVDLRTGQLRSHRKEDMLTKLVQCDYDADAECPIWDAAIERAMGGNRRMMDYIQTALGYTFTGEGNEKVIFFCHGRQDTGKSTILQTAAEILDEYGTKLRMEHFMAHRRSVAGAPAPAHVLLDLSNLEGKRFAMIPEAPDGGEWNDSLLKELSPGGAGRLKIRRMYRDYDFIRIGFALWVDTNHMPSSRSMEGVANRFKIIRFDHQITRPDPHMAKNLRAEWPGILAWIVAGTVRYYREGLVHPPEVGAAVERYAEEQASLHLWKEECLILDPGGFLPTAELSTSYQEFCRRRRKAVQPSKEVLAAYEKWGLIPHRTGQHRGYKGVVLANAPFGTVEDDPLL